MNPPIVYDVTIPKSHNTKSTIKIVQSIFSLTFLKTFNLPVATFAADFTT